MSKIYTQSQLDEAIRLTKESCAKEVLCYLNSATISKSALNAPSPQIEGVEIDINHAILKAKELHPYEDWFNVNKANKTASKRRNFLEGAQFIIDKITNAK